MSRRPVRVRIVLRTPLPLFRAGAATRLAGALGLSGLLWAAILWAGA